MQTILKVSNIEKYYGNKGNMTKAVDNISFEVDKGEFIGIMGASGSGKTTLLNCISTIDSATAGHIFIDGMDITQLNSKKLSKFRREQLGFIFQDFNLLDTLTAYENIALALTIIKTPASEIDVRVRHEYVVNFKGFGRKISEYRVQSGQSASFPGQNYYFAPSVSWSFVSSSKFGVRYYPAGFVFDIAGSSVFVNQPDYTDYYLGFLSSSVAFEMLNLMNPTLNYQAGNIAKLPIRVDENRKARIDALIAENISLCKSDWDSYEVSWNFQTHPFLRFRLNRENSKISDAFAGWQRFTVTQFDRLKANEEELNCIFMEIYGLQDELTSDVEEKDITVRKADLQRDVHSFISYAVGCMFGRYESPAVGKNENAEFLLITEASDFENDIVSLFVSFVRDVYGKETLAENLEFIAAALGGNGGTMDVIRNYFVKKFYGEHVKAYQKRPIYWLLDGGAVKVLFYIHSYHEDTFSHVCEELVKVQCKLAKAAEEDELTPKQRAKLLKQLEKLKVYGSKLKKIAAMHIRLDLDDGVQKNYSKVQGGEDLLPIL